MCVHSYIAPLYPPTSLTIPFCANSSTLLVQFASFVGEEGRPVPIAVATPNARIIVKTIAPITIIDLVFLLLFETVDLLNSSDSNVIDYSPPFIFKQLTINYVGVCLWIYYLKMLTICIIIT